MKNNKCPFLEEVIVRYCKAYPIRKMIPTASLEKEDPCIGCPEKCSIYQEISQTKSVENIKDSKKEFVMEEIKQEKQCIWMKAGVIAYRICTSNYDCKNCEFDQSLTDQSSSYGDSPMVKQAIAKLRTMPADQRKCRYMLTGDISYKLCPNNYECWHCAVDQMVQELISANPLLQRKRARKQVIKVETVKGFSFHPSVYYLPNHIWIKVENDNEVKVGFDDFATKLLGDIADIKLSVENDEAKSVILRIRNRAVKILIVTLGKFVKSNRMSLDNPEVIKQDPYNNGWLFSIEPATLLSNLKDIRKGAEAKKWFEQEIDTLQEMIQQECGLTIADGGELVADIKGRITDDTLFRALKKFLDVEIE
ncbi:MAG: glycine cleavage system protein H [candidate division WOR-3 bacterium]